MVSTELYVAGLKRKEMVEITHGASVDGSRGTRYRLYGTYTDPETKKIHKANSFVSKAKYDEITAKMTAGMPVADMTIEKVEVFAEDSPVDAEPSDLGGLTEPDNAGVPADVGGDEPVPMGDEPSDIQEFQGREFVMPDSGFGIVDAEYTLVGTDGIQFDRDEFWIAHEDFVNGEGHYYRFYNDAGEKVGELFQDSRLDEIFLENGLIEFEAETNVGTTIDDIVMDEYLDEGEDFEDAEDYARKARRALTEREAEVDLTGIIVQDNDPSSPPNGVFATEQEREMEEASRKREYGYTHPAMDDYLPELDDPNFVEDFDESAMDAWELEQERLREEATKEEIQDVQEPLLENVEEEVVVERSQRPEPGTWAGVALDMAMISDDDDDFDWNAWKDEMKESRGAEGYEAYRKRAEMTLREWGESELEEEKHDFTRNPNESFRAWLDEEVRAHGDVSFREWADEEESEETKSAETVTKSAETDQDMETVDTQVAVALGIPPEIWRDTSRDKQDAYIASMMLDVTTVRDLADDGEFELIMAMANEQKETVTAGDLSLIECNVCGITASQLLDDLGGVCDITDPNGGANPNWVRGVSCPFEKYYSLTRAVYDEVEEELRDSQTVVQIHTPRPATAMAAESVSKRASRYARVGRTFNGRGYRKYRTESLMDITKDTSLGDFTSKELTESSAIQGDFDHASLNYSGRQNIQARAETFQADDFGDMEYIILIMLTDEQLEEEYGDYMRDEGIGRKELPQRLEDRYRTADEAKYLREKYLDEGDDYDAETFRAYDDAISDRQRYKIQELGGKVDSNMNRSEASDYIKELQGRESGTWKSAETRGIDTFTEPFEDEERSNWLLAAGIAGVFALGAWLLPKGD